jgi:hypothetical protein
MPLEAISEDFRQAVMDGHNAGDMMIDVNPEIPANARLARTTSKIEPFQAVSMNSDGTVSPVPLLPPSVPAPLQEPAPTVSDAATGFADCPIVHRNVGGQMVTTDERWPLTEQDAAAITKLVESIESPNPRILGLNVGLGDNWAVVLQAAWIHERFSSFASAQGINRDAYAKNMESAGIGHLAVCPVVDPEPGDLDNQELDLLWVGHPDDATGYGTSDQVDRWFGHLKPGAVLAGVGAGTNPAVGSFINLWLEESPELINGSSVWIIRKPTELTEANSDG